MKAVSHSANAGSLFMIAGSVFGALGQSVNALRGLSRLAWDAAAEGTKTAAKASVAIPAAAGLGTGYLAARLTSPGERSNKVKEMQIVNARAKAMKEENLRKLATDLRAWSDREA